MFSLIVSDAADTPVMRLKSNHKQREAAHQHGEARDFCRQVRPQPRDEAADQELNEAGEDRHAGNQRKAALLGRDDGHGEKDTRERGRHQIAATDVPRIQTEQNGADTEHQHGQRHHMLDGLMRCLGRLEHEQRENHPDRCSQQHVLKRRHPENEGRRTLVHAIDDLMRLHRRLGSAHLHAVRLASPKLQQLRGN